MARRTRQDKFNIEPCKSLTLLFSEKMKSARINLRSSLNEKEKNNGINENDDEETSRRYFKDI